MSNLSSATVILDGVDFTGGVSGCTLDGTLALAPGLILIAVGCFNPIACRASPILCVRLFKCNSSQDGLFPS